MFMDLCTKFEDLYSSQYAGCPKKLFEVDNDKVNNGLRGKITLSFRSSINFRLQNLANTLNIYGVRSFLGWNLCESWNQRLLNGTWSEIALYYRLLRFSFIIEQINWDLDRTLSSTLWIPIDASRNSFEQNLKYLVSHRLRFYLMWKLGGLSKLL